MGPAEKKLVRKLDCTVVAFGGIAFFLKVRLLGPGCLFLGGAAHISASILQYLDSCVPLFEIF